MKTIALFLTLILVAFNTGDAYRRVCYYSGWAMYRPSPYNLMPMDIDPRICTHLLFAFATLDDNGTSLMVEDANEEPLYEEFTNLKKQNPELKTMLAVGGWNMGSKLFIRMVSSEDNMNTFASNAIEFLRHYNFDGLDIDWEYPAARGSHSGDKQRFAQHLEIVSTAFKNEAAQTGKERLLLSVAVGVHPDRVRKSYDVPAINRNVDFINLMMYDFHGSWDTQVNVHSALYSDNDLSVDSSIKFWERKGASRDKLVVGVPFYGPKYTLLNETDNGQGSDFNGSTTAVFYEICKLINDHKLQEQILDTERVPYITFKDQWIGYDNKESLTEKILPMTTDQSACDPFPSVIIPIYCNNENVEAVQIPLEDSNKRQALYIHDHGYGGVMVWAIDLDDVTGSCGDGKYPLMKTLFQLLPNDQIVG